VDLCWEEKNKKWLIYAYSKENKEIVAHVFGKRNRKTVQSLWKQLQDSGITFGQICTDNWESFKKIFPANKHLIGKNIKSIEGNNCLLRHRLRRFFRRSCCFSKQLIYHIKAFEMVCFYINFGYI
jgi:IS1 family transposase